MRIAFVLLLFVTACHGEASLGSALGPGDGGSVANPRPVFGASTLWELTFPGTGEDIGHDVALLPSGDLVATASYSGTVDFGDGPIPATTPSGALMRRARADGALVWIRHGVFGRVVVDRAGDVIVTGDALEAAYVAKYAGSDGALIWERSLGLDSQSEAGYVAVAPDGTIYATGWFRGTVELDAPVTNATPDFADAYVIAVSASGTDLWGVSFAAQSSALAVAPDGDVVVAFHTREPTSFGGTVLGSHLPETVLAKLSPAGSLRWVRTQAPPALADSSFSNFTNMLTFTPAGDMVVGQSPWLRAFDSAGLEIWSVRPGQYSGSTTAPDGTLIVHGNGARDLGLGEIVESYVAAIDPDGRAADLRDAFGSSYAVDGNGEIAYVGNTPYNILDRTAADVTIGVRAAP